MVSANGSARSLAGARLDLNAVVRILAVDTSFFYGYEIKLLLIRLLLFEHVGHLV
jgi:hypothetical protein